MAPPDGMGWHDMATAARALAWLQATGGGASPPQQEGAVAAGARATLLQQRLQYQDWKIW